MVSKNIRSLKRLEKDKEELLTHNDILIPKFDEKNPLIWLIDFIGPKNSIYEGEKFTLQFKFSDSYVINI